MSLSRRSFVRRVGLGTAGLLSSSFVTGRGREAAAHEPDFTASALNDGYIRINTNENARGPGQSTMRALHEAISPRVGRGYQPDHTSEMVDAIAAAHGVERANVVVGTGSGPILAAASYAFCTADRHLATVAPTYDTCETTARRMGVPVRVVPVDRSMALDLGALEEAAVGAGLVFVCNPNNPTGTAYGAGVIEDFVRRVKRRSPDTAILLDEAYMDYAHDPEVRTALALALEFPGVFISRTFSKAHGMAGLRVGYALGQPATVSALSNVWHLGSMNTLSAAAAIASIRDTAHIAEERAENARIRQFTINAFREMGYESAESHANCIFINLERPAAWFRAECAERGVRVGRDFPPMEQTHSRISLGTWEEMQTAVGVFRDVLKG